jgi:hypothetical protein
VFAVKGDEGKVGFPPFRGGFGIDGCSLSFVGTVMPSDRSEGVSGDLRGWFHAASARWAARTARTSSNATGDFISAEL